MLGSIYSQTRRSCSVGIPNNMAYGVLGSWAQAWWHDYADGAYMKGRPVHLRCLRDSTFIELGCVCIATVFGMCATSGTVARMKDLRRLDVLLKVAPAPQPGVSPAMFVKEGCKERCAPGE